MSNKTKRIYNKMLEENTEVRILTELIGCLSILTEKYGNITIEDALARLVKEVNAKVKQE